MTTPDRLRASLFALLCLNAADALLTIYAVTRGLASEANPIAAWFLGAGPWVFFGWKLSVAVLVSALLWSARSAERARDVATAGACMYAAIVLFELWGLR